MACERVKPTQIMVTMSVFRFQGKTHMIEPGIEPGTLRLVARSCDHQATRLVVCQNVGERNSVVEMSVITVKYEGKSENKVPYFIATK